MMADIKTMLRYLAALAVINAVIYVHIAEVHSSVYNDRPRRMCGYVGYMLQTQSFSQSIVKTQRDCFNLCLRDALCKSTNYFRKERRCALYNVSHLDNGQKLTVGPESFYAYSELEPDCKDATETEVACLVDRCTLTDNTPRNCKMLFDGGCSVNGVYTIYPQELVGQGIQVYCEMDAGHGEEGGWIVFQRRLDGSVDFYRAWEEYRSGFGNMCGEFWLGNDNLVTLTSEGNWELRVDLEDWEGNTAQSQFGSFRIVGDLYNLNIGPCVIDSCSAGDSMSNLNGLPFTTKDIDNDRRTSSNCAQERKGAWWFRNCGRSHLNGPFLRDDNGTVATRGITWYDWKSSGYSMKKCTMKIREFIVSG